MKTNVPNSLIGKAHTICDGHVYLNLGNRQLLLCHPGTWIDQKLAKKINQLKNSINFVSVIDESLKENFKTKLSELKSCTTETSRTKKSQELQVLLAEFCRSESDFLNWSLACFEVFSVINENELTEIHETDINLFKKSLISSAISVWLNIIGGYHQFEFLSDSYHLAFLQDAGLVNKDYSYRITQALDNDSLSAGKGLIFLLEQNVSSDEIKLYKEHPFLSYEYIKDLNILNNPQMLDSILYGHELSDGEGFPFGYTEAIIASWEQVLILSDHLVKFHSEEKFNFMNVFKEFLSKKNNKLPVGKVLKWGKNFFSGIVKEECA